MLLGSTPSTPCSDGLRLRRGPHLPCFSEEVLTVDLSPWQERKPFLVNRGAQEEALPLITTLQYKTSEPSLHQDKTSNNKRISVFSFCGHPPHTLQAQTSPGQRTSRQNQHYLPLALSFQVYYTHVDDGTEVGEGFHSHYIGALLIAVHVELQTNTVSGFQQETSSGKQRVDKEKKGKFPPNVYTSCKQDESRCMNPV